VLTNGFFPFVLQNEMDAMRNSGRKTETLSTFWSVSDGPDGLAKAVKKLQADAEAAVKAGEKAPVTLFFHQGASSGTRNVKKNPAGIAAAKRNEIANRGECLDQT
jgi:hypothetical protein